MWQRTAKACNLAGGEGLPAQITGSRCLISGTWGLARRPAALAQIAAARGNNGRDDFQYLSLGVYTLEAALFVGRSVLSLFSALLLTRSLNR